MGGTQHQQAQEGMRLHSTIPEAPKKIGYCITYPSIQKGKQVRQCNDFFSLPSWFFVYLKSGREGVGADGEKIVHNGCCVQTDPMQEGPVNFKRRYQSGGGVSQCHRGALQINVRGVRGGWGFRIICERLCLLYRTACRTRQQNSITPFFSSENG